MKALEGIRVLDLTHMLSGPYAGMMLADLGAETIKVEPPGRGEGTRVLLSKDPKNSIEGMGAYFLTLNRNKKSVTINLKSDRGKNIFYELVKKSDVVLYNFGVGVAERLGIDYQALSKLNKKIISCSITGFGETGPHRKWPSFDLVAQGTGGGMSITGDPEGGPMRSGVPTGDIGGGLMGVIGILSALQARNLTGEGQHVDISMQDAQISLLNYMATMYFLSGEIPSSLGNSHFVHVPYGTFTTSDGHIILAVITDNFWKSLMNVMKMPELDVPENDGQPGRLKNKDLINSSLNAELKTMPQEFWLKKMQEARIPCAPVNNFKQALNDPHILERNMVVEIAHPNGQKVKQPGNPIKLSKTNDDSFSPPPLLGQDTEDILQRILGMSLEEISILKSETVL